MRHLVDHRKLGRTASHRKALFRNMASSLILSERIETTLPKAKELRRLADQLITLGKTGTLHARRQAAEIVQNPEALKKLFDGLAARFKERAGGYTRIFQFGSRRGDGADMAAIEYLGFQLPVKEKKGEKKEKRKEEKKKEAKKKEEKKPKTEKKVLKGKTGHDIEQVDKKAEKKDEVKAEKKLEKKGKWSLFGGRKKKD